MELWLFILLIILVGVIFSIIFFILGNKYRQRIAEAEIGSAEIEAKRILDESIRNAEAKKKEIILEGKDEVHKLINSAEKDISERRKEVQRQERRIQQKEELLDKKSESIDVKEQIIVDKVKQVDEKLNEVETLKKSQFDMLEKISGFTSKQAREYLFSTLEEELLHDKAVRIREFEQNLKDEMDEKTKEVLSVAIQRCASEYVSEATISVVPLPNDEMKGRIIGREGRNIRAIETLTGVDLIIDDTPEAITLSCFDPVRREVARITLEKLIMDGRIHPAKIEEMIGKARKEVEAAIKTDGQRAVMEIGITGVHPEIVKLLGRLRYRTSYGQNVLKHSIEVAYICEALASEIGADALLAKRSGLLHDIGKAVDHELEGSHVDLGVEIARKYKENEIVLNAIAAHHGDIEPNSSIAWIVQAADAISAARPGARRENLDSYIKRLEKLEGLASSYEGVERSFAIQAGREVRIIVKPDIISDDEMPLLAREICKKIESELDYPGQIKISMIRENRVVDYAK